MKKFIFQLLFIGLSFIGFSQTTVFQEGFETLPLAVTSSGTPGWSRTSHYAKTGTYSDSSRVAQADTSYLTTNSFSTIGNTYVVLEFAHICKLEFFDRAAIEVSTNGGVSYTRLTGTEYLGAGQFTSIGNSFTAASYPTDWSAANDAAIPTNSWWKIETFDISVLAANQANVKVRFKLYDGNNNGHFNNFGWLVDDIKVITAASELIPPVVTLQAPVLQDTLLITGPFEVNAQITDISGIDSAFIVYSINGGTDDTIGMVLTGTNIYSGFIPSQSYNTHVDYQVFAIDNSPAANTGQSLSKWFYVKKGPDIVTLGTGTLQNSGTDYPAPYGNFYYGAKHQILIKASELSALGVSAGPIVSLGFDVVSGLGLPLTNFTIMMGHTTQTSISTWISGLTTVYTVPTYSDVVGWNTHVFTTPFVWDGTSNIVVETCFNNSSYVSNGNAVFNQTATSFNSIIYYYGDNTSVCSAPQYINTSLQRPNMQIGVPPNNNTNDAGVTQIINPTGTVVTGVATPINVRIKNFGVQALTSAQIGWSVNGILQAPVPWTGNLTQDQSSNSIFLDNFTFANGPYTIKAWTFLPNGQTDQGNMNDTTAVNVFACASILSGNYSVGGTGADYPTIGAALTALELCGINGPVTMNINPGTYQERIIIPVIQGISVTNTVTFKGNGAGTILNYALTTSNERYVVLLNNSEHIILDSLTINIPDTAAFGWGIFITNESENIIIRNCNINVPANSTLANYAGIVASNSYSSATTTGNTVKKLTISNNTIKGGYYGITIMGESANKVSNLLVTNNIIEDVHYYGLYLNQIKAPVITKNTIKTRSTGSSTTTFSSNIYVLNIDSTFTISSNKIRDIGQYGIYLSGATNTFGGPSHIANNMIGGGFRNTGTTTSGIYLTSAANINIYYNSVNMDGVSGRALHTTTSATILKVLNNSFAFNGTGNGHAAYYESTTSLATNNYNNYFSGNSTNFVYYGTAVANLAALQAVNVPAGNDINSKVGNPNYTTPMILYPTGTQLWQGGTPVLTVPNDIDDNPRNAVTPCIGAAEYTPATDDAALIAILSPAQSECNLGSTEVIEIIIKNYGTTTMTSVNASYKVDGSTAVTQTFAVNIPMNGIDTLTFSTTVDLTTIGIYNFNFWVTKSGDNNQLNDSILNFKLYHSHNFYSGPYTMGFEPNQYFADWSVFNPGGSNTTWTIPYNSTTYANTGDNSALFLNGTSNTGEDWLFSRCFDFLAGTTYEISFYYRNGSTTTGNNLELKIGTQKDPVQMTSSLVNLPGILNTTYIKATKTFTVPTTGVYYFGWRAYSAPTSTYAYIDDINIKIIPPIEASIIDMTSPISGCGLGVDTIEIVIKNTGSDTLNTTLNASYQANGSTIISEIVSLNNFAPNQTISYVFTTLIDLSTANVDSIFDIKAWIDLAGDPLQFNDTIEKTIVSSFIPNDPIVSNMDIYYGQSATIAAISNDSLYWFNGMTSTTPLFAGNPFVTPVLFDTTTYYVEAMNGMPNLKITEITQYRLGSGQTPVYPSWVVGEDFAEITNLGSAPANLQGYVFDVYGEGARTYTFPSINLPAGQVLLLHIGTGTNNPTNYLYNTGGATDAIFSTSISGYALRNNTNNILDAVATNGYTFQTASGVTSNDWSNLLSTSNAGVIRIISDNNTAADWIAASSTTTQTIGSLNPQLAGSLSTGGNGCKSNRVPVTVNIIPQPFDAGIASIVSPIDACTDGSEIVEVLLYNSGANDITSGLSASYVVNNGSPVTQSVGVSIPVGDTILFTFTVPININLTVGDSTIQIKAYTTLTADGYNANDTTNTSATFSFTPPVPTANNVSIPYATSTTLNASSPYFINWYDNIAATSAVDTGTTYTTPILYSNTTFYVSSSSTQGGFQTQIGTGTLTQSYVPCYGWFDYSWSTSLFLPAELNFSGNIDTLIFYVNNTISPYTMNDQRVYLGHAAYSAFTDYSYPGTTGLTQVYQGTVTWSPGWVKIPLSTPFNYNGTSTLVLQWENHDGSYISGYPSFGASTVPSNLVKYNYDDVTFPSSVGYGATTRPNTIFVHDAPGCESAKAPVTVTVTGTPNVDAGIVSIDMPISPTNLGTQNVDVTLHNYGLNPLTAVNINWTVNGVPQQVFNWGGNLAHNTSINNVNIGTFNFTLGNHVIKAWTSQPNGVSDVFNLNDTTQTNIMAFDPLNGIYTIGGTTPDFINFTQAINALNNYGVSGPVTFKVRTGTYNEKLLLGAYNGASATNTVTFMPDAGATVSLSVADTFVVKISNAKFYIFDGSNNGTNSRDFSIINNSTNANTTAIWIASVSDSISVKNCKIAAGSNVATSTFGIYAAGTTITTSGTGNNNYLVIHNNEFTKSYFGVYVKSTSTLKNNNLLITRNFIGSNSQSDFVTFRGVDIAGANAPLVEGNEIINMQLSTSVSVSGIEIGNDVTDAKISKNRIRGLRSTSTGGYGAYGINIASGTGTSNIEISNNFLSDIIGSGYSATSTWENPFGIRVTGGTNHKIWHNSVNMHGAPTTGSNPSMSAAFIVTSSLATGLDVRNNIFANNMTGLTGSKSYSIYATAGTVFNKIDNNDYFVSGPFGTLGYFSSDILTLSNWRLITLKDTNSINVNPNFIGINNLHTFSTTINNEGAPIPAVTDDIEGTLRNVNTPDIGGFEFDPLNLDLSLMEIVSPTSNCDLSANEILIVKVKNNGLDTITGFSMSYSINGGTPVSEPFTGSLATDSVYTFTFATPANLSTNTAFNIQFHVILTGDQYAMNDTMSVYLYPKHDFYSGAYTMGFEGNENMSGWRQYDGNTDGRIWEYPFINATFAHTGTNSARFNQGSTSIGNDWFISECFDLEGGKSYKVEFWYRSSSTVSSHNLAVKLGTDATNTSTFTTTVLQMQGINNTTYQMASGIVSISTDGVYNFAWHATSPASTYVLYIDDINIRLLPPRDAGITELVNVVDLMNGGDQINLQAKVKNFGSDTLTSIPVKYSLNGGTAITETWIGTLLPDSAVTYTFATAFTVPGGQFDICAWTQLSNDGNHGNDTTCKTTFGIPLMNLPFTDDLEGGVYFYTTGATSQWQMGTPSASVINTAHSPVNSWATNLSGNYSNSSNYNLYSPRFNFSNSVNNVIGFWHWYNTESGFDGGRLQYTTNNGQTWQTLGVVSDPLGTNWYNTSNINGAPAFTGLSSGWVYSKFDLTQFNNFPVPVQFRFNFYSNVSNNNYNGWAIDDFEIFQSQIPTDAGVIAIVSPVGSVVNGSTNTVEVTIKNFGTSPLTTIPVRYRVNNGVAVQEQWTGNLQPGATVNYTFSATVSQSTSFNLCAWTRVNGDTYTNNDTICENITVTAAQYDAGVVEITAPGTQTTIGQQVTVSAKIKNFGTETLTSMSVAYDLNAGAQTVETWTGTLAPNAEVVYTFTNTYLSLSGNYVLCVKTQLANDLNTGNDKVCKTINGSVGIENVNNNALYLGQNIPNPANGNTMVSYSIPESGRVVFEIVNVIGQSIYKIEKDQTNGNHFIEIDANKLADGIYYYTLNFGDQKLTRKLVVSK
ncbi:MAG: choice-of-anchor J domain-containing protein [Bacteroidales bacterium]|nr:choice-of-anchor J domain-containing protein [Bacteroidales bacterium]